MEEQRSFNIPIWTHAFGWGDEQKVSAFNKILSLIKFDQKIHVHNEPPVLFVDSNEVIVSMDLNAIFLAMGVEVNPSAIITFLNGKEHTTEEIE